MKFLERNEFEEVMGKNQGEEGKRDNILLISFLNQ